MGETPTLPNFSGAGYAARLQRHGFTIIGQGGGLSHPSTVVLARPGQRGVVKVGVIPTDDPWPLYAEWCFNHPGPLRPSIRSLRWHGRGFDAFFVASLDRLQQPLNLYDPTTMPRDEEAERTMDGVYCWYRFLEERLIDPYDAHPETPLHVLAGWLSASLRAHSAPDKADLIDTLHGRFPHLMFDPKPANWMYTSDRRMVFTDPFLRTTSPMPPTSSRLKRGQSNG